MLLTRRQGILGVAATAFASSGLDSPAADGRTETLRHITGGSVNTLDPTTLSANRESFGLGMNVYDRLVRFGTRTVGGSLTFDNTQIVGELAERYDVSPDGLRITFHLRADAIWHDGSPVMAEDVKWSLDRHVSAKSLAASQFQTGSLTRADQFRIVGPHTIEVLLEKPDRLALSNFAVPFAIMINSKLARQYATAEDPWAQDWMKANTAAGGAYRVESYKPGVQVTLVRNETWKGGQLPFFRRVLSQTVPEAATRGSLIERGDADIVIDLQPSDVAALRAGGRVKIDSIPQSNGFSHLAFNTQMAPFDNVLVRQAIAAALPYQNMFEAALFNRGRPLYGADWTTPPSINFPQAMPLRQNLDKAKALMAEAALAKGFETSFSFSTSAAATAEPMAALIREALGRIGVNVAIQKLPEAQFSTRQAEKKLPFYMDSGTAWLPESYYFFYLYFTRDQRWNFSNWSNERIVELTSAARFERDHTAYEAQCREMITILADQVPLLMLWQPNLDAIMTSRIEGFTYQFYRQVDFRSLRRG